MPKQKFDLKNMTHNEIYGYVILLKKEINKWKTLYNKTQQKYQDMVMKYEKPIGNNKEKNPYLIDGFTLNIGD